MSEIREHGEHRLRERAQALCARDSELSAIRYPLSASPVYLTFDDGPDPEWTPRILDLLAQAQMHATFFMIGEQARKAPALARRVAAEGHGVGNHTFSHKHPWAMGASAARAEVRRGAEALSDAVGIAPALFRPPHGRRRTCMTDEAERLGERVAMWDLSAIDWGPFGRPAKIAERLANANAHDVILMHDGRNRSNRPDALLQALPGFLDELRRRGCSSVRLADRR